MVPILEGRVQVALEPGDNIPGNIRVLVQIPASDSSCSFRPFRIAEPAIGVGPLSRGKA